MLPLSLFNTDPKPWITVLLSILAHGAAFTLVHTFLSRKLFGNLYGRLSKREKMRFDERLVSLVHAVISTQGSIRAFFQLLPRPLTLDGIVQVSGAYAFVASAMVHEDPTTTSKQTNKQKWSRV